MDKTLQDKAIDFKGKDYVLVKDRVIYFNDKYPKGSITTELVSLPESENIIVKATVKPTEEQTFTGYSQATIGDGYINKTSALENAETSAVGRALAFMGIGVIESIASIDEINKTTHPTRNSSITPQEALERAKKAIMGCSTLDELDKVKTQIDSSKNIPNRRSNEGKEMRDELEELVNKKGQELIDKGEQPFD